MKLGIIGGLSWASTHHYYELINRGVAQLKGKQHSANLLISSLDFQPVIDAQMRSDWQWIGERLVKEALFLQEGGAEGFLIASNTIHLVLSQVQAAVKIPCINIFDSVAAQADRLNIKTLGLLGTRYTMDEPFFKSEYAKRGVKILTPDDSDKKSINAIIFRELIHGNFCLESRTIILQASKKLLDRGCDGILLGCTELSVVADHWSLEKPCLDSTKAHCRDAVEWLMSNTGV